MSSESPFPRQQPVPSLPRIVARSQHLLRAAPLAAVFLAGLCCVTVEQEEPQGAPAAVGVQEAVELRAALLEIGERYEEFGRLDDEMRWAPWLCRMPDSPRARLSASTHERTHGEKLYGLFVKDPESYAGLPASDRQFLENGEALLPGSSQLLDQLGQVIVKEAWLPERYEASPERVDEEYELWGPSGLRPVVLDGGLWRAAERKGLFVMYQAPEGTPGTDAGWVYGTLTPDGREVTAQGRLAACMQCHLEAGPGRLFGLPRDEGYPDPR